MHSSETPRDGQYSEPTKGHELKRRRTPLPWAQLFIVYLIQFSEPITATVIYPFINQFVRETGITRGDETKTGYFAGMIESTFFLAEAITVVFWGMASDRFGRRPVLLLGPLGLSLVMVAFGMTTAFPWLVVLRFLQGAFNGNIGVSKAVIGELTDSTNMADAFARIPLMWSTGITLGPIIGGFLSRPAERWPNTLGKLAYLKAHPYFLPCLTAAMIAFLSFLGGFVALKETSPLARHHRGRTANAQRDIRNSSVVSDSSSLLADDDGAHYGTHRNHSPAGSSSASLTEVEDGPFQTHDKPPSFRKLLTPEIVTLLVNYCLFTFLDMSMQVLLPLMWSTSIEHGGLAFTPYLIGITMSVYGMFSAVVQLCILGPIIRRFGARKVYIVTFSCLLVPFSCYPIASSLARRAGHADWKVWCVILLQLLTNTAVPACYGSVQVMVQDLSPSKSALGAMNGLAQAVSSASRALGPWVASSLYAISLQHHLAGGHAVYYILLVIVAGGIRLSFTLPNSSMPRCK